MCALGNSAIEPMWSKWAWVMKMSVIASARDADSASMRTGEIQSGMPNLRGKAGAVLVLHEAGVDEHVALALLRQDERERQVHRPRRGTCR